MSILNSGTNVAGTLLVQPRSRSDFEVKSESGTVELLDGIAEEWRQLCEEGPCNEPFFRPEWIAAAARAFGRRQRLLLITVRHHGRLRAVLPMLEKKGWSLGIACTRLRSASLIPRFELVHGSGADATEAVAALWQYLQKLRGWDVIELANVPEGGAAALLHTIAHEDGFPTHRVEYARTPYAVLTEHRPGPDFSRLGRTSRFRGQLRQGWRELSKRGPLNLRRAERVDPEALERFYDLEKSGWKGKEGTAIACKPELKEFYDAVVNCAEQYGYLSMYYLEQGDVTLAAHLGLTYGGRYYPIKVAYDERFSEYRPGHVIIGLVLEDCIARGLSEVDFLGDWTEAKAKWTSNARQHTVCSIYRNSVIGRILCAQDQLKYRANRSLRGAVRSLVAGARSR